MSNAGLDDSARTLSALFSIVMVALLSDLRCTNIYAVRYTTNEQPVITVALKGNVLF